MTDWLWWTFHRIYLWFFLDYLYRLHQS
jgi:hypothetical protein